MLRCTVEAADRAAPIVDSLNSLAAGYGGNRINRCRPHHDRVRGLQTPAPSPAGHHALKDPTSADIRIQPDELDPIPFANSLLIGKRTGKFL
jgi:hypothetical protein